MLSVHLPRPSLFSDEVPAQDPSIPRSLLHHIVNHFAADSVVSYSSSVTVDDDALRVPPSPGEANYEYGPRDSRSPTHFSFGSATPYAFPYTTRESSAHDPAALPMSAHQSQNRFQSAPYTQPRSYGALPRISTDQRRISDAAMPQVAGAHNHYNYNNNDYEVEASRSPESPFLPRVASLGSLRQEDARSLGDVSPFQPSFPSISNSPQYILRSEENTYGSSPPGTATSSSSTAPSQESTSTEKNYSFVALAGNTVRKRPRRRYDEIERLYHCSWPECTKAYGTLNHLNAHVQMQKHGPKRSPNEFKELRKQWRKAKKEYDSPGLGPIRRSMSLYGDDLGYHGASHRSFSHPLSRGSYGVDHGHQPLRYPSDTQQQQQSYGGLDYRHPIWSPPSTSRGGGGEIYHQSPMTTPLTPAYPTYLDNHAQIDRPPPPSSVNNNSPAHLPPGSMLLRPLMSMSGHGQAADNRGYPETYYDDSEARDAGQPPERSGSGDEY